MVPGNYQRLLCARRPLGNQRHILRYLVRDARSYLLRRPVEPVRTSGRKSFLRCHFCLRSVSLKRLREDISLSQIQDGSRVVSPRDGRRGNFAESGDRSDPANGICNQHFAKNLAYFLDRPGFQNHGIETVVGKVRHDRSLGITAGDNQLQRRI